MTPSNSIAVNLVRRPARAASFVIKAVWAVIVLFFVCLLWVMLFLLFLPFLVLGEILGLRKKFQAAAKREEEQVVALAADGRAAEVAPLRVVESRSTDHFIFDRRRDISKLFGCNTRNVQYRWSVFGRRLAQLKSEFSEPKAIDFGAGSLRDSYELSKLGFSVVSVDLDESLLQRYAEFYDWKESTSAPQLFARPLDDLLREAGANSFHLAIAFDVIEHLEDPPAFLKPIRSLLRPQGLLFTIVPNGRAVFERYFKYSIAKQRKRNIPWTPGVPHLQFKTPQEWEEVFEAHGFAIREHDMTIGFLVNDCWVGLFGLPLRIYVCPVLQMLAHILRLNFRADAFEGSFYPAWLMERVNVWDQLLKRPLRERFGWNLIVAQRES